MQRAEEAPTEPGSAPEDPGSAQIELGSAPAGDANGLPSRAEALVLLDEWVQSDSLRRHCLAVEAAMRAQARERGGDEELWGLTGLLHDLDYDRYPDPDTGHPRMAMAELERLRYPPELIRAVASHADYLEVPRESDMERALAAVDELCGFILASAYVRPSGIHGLTPKSVRKKLKQPSFAAAVNREDIARGAQELGLELDRLIESVVAALEPLAVELGIDGQAGAAGG
jgi:putative nucleotidyltransferase with HDIG domain